MNYPYIYILFIFSYRVPEMTFSVYLDDLVYFIYIL